MDLRRVEVCYHMKNLKKQLALGLEFMDLLDRADRLYLSDRGTTPDVITIKPDRFEPPLGLMVRIKDDYSGLGMFYCLEFFTVEGIDQDRARLILGNSQIPSYTQTFHLTWKPFRANV